MKLFYSPSDYLISSDTQMKRAAARDKASMSITRSAWHGWSKWSAALEDACGRVAAFGPEVVVVSLGVDTYKDDPISSFKLESEHYLRVGERIARLKKPTVYLMEGGYAIDAIGVNVVNTLAGHLGRG